MAIINGPEIPPEGGKKEYLRTGPETPLLDRWMRRFKIGAFLALVGGVGVALGAAAYDLMKEDKIEQGAKITLLDQGHETYPEAAIKAAQNLLTLYSNLKARGSWERTEQENANFRTYLQPKQDALLTPTYVEMLGEGLVGKFAETKAEPQSKRDHLYDKADAKQESFRKQAAQSGRLTGMAEDNADLPYFCEQVGENSGIANDKDSLYMHEKFLPLLGSVVQLVNFQIDLVNQEQAAYGLPVNFPKIPHVQSIKVSGAFREVSQTKKMLNSRLRDRTTKSLSAHWSGFAVDMGSTEPDNGHMLRFLEAMKDEDGDVMIPKGEKLGNTGFGKTTRLLVSTFIGRALWSLIEPMSQEEYLTLMPLWEGGQKNWHVVLMPQAESD